MSDHREVWLKLRDLFQQLQTKPSHVPIENLTIAQLAEVQRAMDLANETINKALNDENEGGQ